MSSNSSSLNDSLLPPRQPSVSLYMHCLLSNPSSFIFISIDIAVILFILPLCILILYLGVQQWRTSRSASSAPAMSHSDCFTYHMVVMELSGAFGYILTLVGICKAHLNILFVAGFFTGLNWYGQILFHMLTCVERYVAVVHPVTYLSMRNEQGIRIRNVTISCAWLISLAGMMMMMMTHFFSILDICLLVFSVVVISFCSLSVLLVLIRPGPGEQGRVRQRVDQSKLRAFYTIMVILGVLGVRFAWNVVWEIMFMWGGSSNCVIMATCVWFNLPTSLVLPLLYLHRAGKLLFCKKIPNEDMDDNLQK